MFPAALPWAVSPEDTADSCVSAERQCELLPELGNRALTRWLDKESKARILLSSDMVIHWMSEAAEPLVSGGMIRIRNGRWQPRTKRLCDFIHNTKIDDHTCVIFQDRQQCPWVIWGRRLSSHPISLIGLVFQPPRQTTSFGALVDMQILTKTEGRVVEMLLNGFETGQIAQELHISSQTLKTHIKHAYSKLGVRSRGDLFAQATAFARP